MKRLALWCDEILEGANGYAPRAELLRAYEAKAVHTSWWLGPRLSSIRLKTGGMWKVRERMEPLPAGTDPQRWLRAIEEAGINHPSSYADCYHQKAPPSPRIPWTFNGMFQGWQGGPWAEAKLTGDLRGAWWRYDLRSAYRWAGGQGLPDPACYTVQKGGEVQDPGLWWITVRGSTKHLPTIFRTPGAVVMSSEEIDRYQVAHDVIRGVIWSKMMPKNYVDATLDKLPCAKESGRAYWGRWIARDPLRVESVDRTWEIPNMAANYIWGWLIVGRVRQKLWESSERAAHVYVDEVLVPHRIETGAGLGDWHLKQEYPQGVTVHRTGWYAPRGTGAPTMQTGVKRKDAA